MNLSGLLALDLNGDGVKTGGKGYFDHRGDGWAEHGGWVSQTDGVLAIDRNGNGVIDNGKEVFGAYAAVGGGLAANGFVALKQVDSNSDGVIDSRDADWGKLRVFRWTDRNGDSTFNGASEGRLDTLAAHGIASLSLSHETSTNVDASGDEHRKLGSYTRTDGTSRDMSDVWFSRDSRRLGSYVGIPLPDGSGYYVLPEIPGTGRVLNLRERMRRDAAIHPVIPADVSVRTERMALSQLVAAFEAATGADVRDELAEKILPRWADAEDATAGDYGDGSPLAYTTPQKLAVFEAFRGSQWKAGESNRHPDQTSAQHINRDHLFLFENLRAQLLSKTDLKGMFEAERLLLNGKVVLPETSLTEADAPHLTLDYSAVFASPGAEARRSEFLRSLAVLEYRPPEMDVRARQTEIIEALESVSAEWSYEYQYHLHYLAAMVSDGVTINVDEYIGDGSLNVFRSSDGRKDELRGAGGSDVYQLAQGTGHDVVVEGRGGRSEKDVVQVAPGLAQSDIVLFRTSSDLVIGLVDSEGKITDSLRAKNHYSSADARIEKVELGDSARTTYTEAELAGMTFLQGDGTEGTDTYDASLSPGPLGEEQRGRRGSDVYLLGRGTGHETVDEAHRNHEGSDGDAIRLKPGLVLADVRLSRQGADLEVGLVDSEGILTDSLTIKGHFRGGAHKVESLESSDGTVLRDLRTAEVKLQNGASGGVIEGLGNGVADVFGIDAGSDTFRGMSGDDVYGFGLGSGVDNKVEEGYRNRAAGDGGDTIRLGAGVTSSMVKKRRTMWDLVIELVDSENEVTDSLTVKDYYHHGWAKVERVVLHDGSVLWTSTDFDAMEFNSYPFDPSRGPIRGDATAEVIAGFPVVNDVFDADAGGDDILYGLGGDDEYRLGSGTGSDEVREGYSYVDRDGHAVSTDNDFGDEGDRIRVEAGFGTGDVRLRRDDRHLWVELLGPANAQGVRSVTDSLKVVDHYERTEAQIETVVFADGTVWDTSDLHAVALRGGMGNDNIHGRDDSSDTFDSDAGGNDKLYGLGGDDEYRLGTGTGMDTVREGRDADNVVRLGDGDAGDLIRVESGHGTGDVRLRRDTNHLYVELLGPAGADGSRAVSDSLKVHDYFQSDSAKVEKVEFADGTVWGVAELHAAPLRGGTGDEGLHGRDDMDDVFDSDAGGDDRLHGYRGDDEYRLGTGTGSDTIYESHGNDRGDGGDLVMVKAGHGTDDVRLRQDGDHLYVELLGTAGDDGVRPVTDSLKVHDHFGDTASRIERVKFAGGTVWSGDFVVGTGQADFIKSTSATETLHGGGGDDTYVFSLEFGDDRIVDSGGTDKVKMSSHGAGGLSFSREGDDMVMGVIGSNDRVTFDNWYAEGGSRKVERIETSSEVLLTTAAERMATAMAAFVSGGGSASDFVSRNHEDYWETLSGTPGG